MTRRLLSTLGASLLLGAMAGPCGVAAQVRDTREAPASGAYLYRIYCATCHGASGRGDGPVADLVVPRAPDLTGLTRMNGGAFPRNEVIARLDGTKPLASHSAAGMPSWSEIFRATEGPDDRTIRARINALANYLESLQVK